MPQKGFDRKWDETYCLDFLDRVFKVKRIFRVSYKTVIFRLIDKGHLEKDIWPKINTSLRNKCKIRISQDYEPDKLEKSDFKTDWLERLVRIAFEKNMITKSRASEILGISLQEMRSRTESWAEV